MNGIILFSSPNNGGNTSNIINYIKANLNINFKILNVYSLKISPCIDCKYCSKVEGKCSLKDDMTIIYEEINKAEFIILASPMYFGMFPAPLKALIDRTQVQWSVKNIFKRNIEKEKLGAFIFTAGAVWENMFIPMDTVGKYFFNTIGCNLIEKLYINNTDDRALSNIDNETEQKISTFIKNINKYIS